MADQEDRTEAASARRLQRAREEGNVPISRELSALAVMGSAALVLAMAAPAMAQALARRMAVFLEQAHRLDPVAAMHEAALATIAAAAPFVLAALVAGAAAILLQTGFLLNLSALMPKLDRLDPRRGLKRVFGLTVLTEAGKSVLKVGVVAWAGWQALPALMPQLRQALAWDAGGLTDGLTRQVMRILFSMLAAQAVIATLDVVRARLQHARSLRMSREDLRDEHKETEGDPRIKGRIRQIRVQRARKRMMAAVPTATVVLTNPTHYAVALAYDRAGGGAPKVVAKGVDDVAARIREVAQRSRVPLVANPPLARALYRVALDAEIPAEHYKAVAEIVAYVWRLSGRVRAARAAESRLRAGARE
ncbi:EscU/YscU/HrcU family type III secretion system export apparatus switch protein [Limobrevibacterium gyesilva]|uniref:Flagellar type III secretion system protein FlhB n=1 Tax=Limobrevibacterium gyesilva TaxID=2991712 RepID=A0AA41YLV4_9PROT|nr:flagellar type III secretion system protein FlhB [Limobrevibacterium gyesilva]MCW3475095.1 flagellar type III secretion system protein FlhB [Limobrevibacterium gyesilva]